MMPFLLLQSMVAPMPVVTAAPAPPAYPPPLAVVGHHGATPPPFTVQVEVTAGGETLWSGPLRVARGAGSSLRHERTEPPPTLCDPERGHLRVRNTGLSITLSVNRYGEDAPDALSVNTRWSKPADNRCPHLGRVFNSRIGQHRPEKARGNGVPRKVVLCGGPMEGGADA